MAVSKILGFFLAANRAIKTDDLRIVKTGPLLSPAILAEEIPLTDTASTRVYEAPPSRRFSTARMRGSSW